MQQIQHRHSGNRVGVYNSSPVGGFNPRSITGLVLWSRSDLAYTNAAQTVPCVLDNDPVWVWTDKSASGNHLKNGLAAAQPTYQTNQVNGYPSIRFDGTTDVLTANWTQEVPVTTFIIENQITWTSNDTIFDGKNVWGMRLYQYLATPGLALSCGSALTTVTGEAVGTWQLVTAIANGASSSLQVNAGTVATGNAGTGHPDGLLVGANIGAGAGANFANVEVAEILVYNAALGAVDIATIQTYLRDRYLLW